MGWLVEILGHFVAGVVLETIEWCLKTSWRAVRAIWRCAAAVITRTTGPATRSGLPPGPDDYGKPR